MKIIAIIVLFMTLPLSANSFRYEDRPYDFRLVISLKEISFSSESHRHTSFVRDCNLSLARQLNSEILSLAQSEESGKLNLVVDDKIVKVGLKSKLRNYLQNMRVRMIQFALEEKEKCK